MKIRNTRYTSRTREKIKQSVTLNLLKLIWKSQSIIKKDRSFTGTVHLLNYSLSLNRTLTNAVQMSSQCTLNSSRLIEEYVLKSTKPPLFRSDNGFSPPNWLLIQWWLIVDLTLRIKLQWHLNRISNCLTERGIFKCLLRNVDLGRNAF